MSDEEKDDLLFDNSEEEREEQAEESEAGQPDSAEPAPAADELLEQAEAEVARLKDRSRHLASLR